MSLGRVAKITTTEPNRAPEHILQSPIIATEEQLTTPPAVVAVQTWLRSMLPEVWDGLILGGHL